MSDDDRTERALGGEEVGRIPRSVSTVGVLSIIFGGLGLLLCILGFRRAFGGEYGSAVGGILKVLFFLASGLGLTGGMGLLGQKKWGIPVSSAYGIASLAASAPMGIYLLAKWGTAAFMASLFPIIVGCTYPIVVLAVVNSRKVKKLYETKGE